MCLDCLMCVRRDGELDEGFRTRVEAASQAGEVLRFVAEMEDQLSYICHDCLICAMTVLYSL